MRSVQWDRCVIAGVCAAALGLAGPVHAAQPAGEAGDELNEQALGHVSKAVEHFEGGRYHDAEEEFNRAVFFAPNWRPLHFNLGVVAEAQGKLGTAVTEYKAFRPHGTPEEQMMVDQRLAELSDRKTKIARAYRRQIGVSTAALTLGVAGLAGGVVLFVLDRKGKAQVEELRAEAGALNTEDPLMMAQKMELEDAATAKEKQIKSYMVTGIYLGLFGLLFAAYSFLPLSQAIKSKRQLEGIALGPTRLKWNGGVGATLSF